MSETELINYINKSGGIPLRVITESNWNQFYINLGITLLGSVFILYYIWIMLSPKIMGIFLKIRLKKMTKSSKNRHLLLIKHTNQDLFNSSMIDQKTLREVQKSLQKFNGEDFDLVLHTPGGEVFSALFISRLLKEYPGKIRAIIPSYAMSGGTLLALSADEIYMGNSSCLGPVDPQLGGLFKYGSAKSWDRIMRMKGNKAEDQTISFAFTGRQYTQTISKYISDLVGDKMTGRMKTSFVRFLTSGNVEHALPLTRKDLEAFGLEIKNIDLKSYEQLIKIISSSSCEGVTAI